MKGAILRKGEKYYTYLKKIFQAIDQIQIQYNWLITDCECIPQTTKYERMFSTTKEYIWLTGKQLTEMINEDDFQWIWAVLSGFPVDVSLSEILKYQLPNIIYNYEPRKLPLSFQHPLAEIEITPIDSSLVTIISKKDVIIENFRNYFPLSEDLESYIST